MTEVSDEFKNQALFDLNLKYDLQKQANIAANKGQEFEMAARRNEVDASRLKTEASLQAKRTKALAMVETELNLISDPQVKKQAEAYLDSLFAKPIDGAGPMDSLSEQEQAIKSAEKKAAKIDIDGSKKSLWGKLKNKANNFLKPHNPKRRIEEALAKLQIEMATNAPTYNNLRDEARRHGSLSGIEIIKTNNSIKRELNSAATDRQYQSEKIRENGQVYFQEQQKAEAQMEARLEVRDNAAKEIELRSAAREGIGIKDINANSGVDKLADRAKAMEGMTPQQRLAFRMKELRGTQKETAQPVVKRELDSNIMSQKLNNQRQ